MSTISHLIRNAAWIVSAAAIFAGAIPSAVAMQDAQAVAQPATEAQYIRVQDSDNGDRTQLQVSVRTLRPTNGVGPVVHLVGVVHIGDAAYYHKLQEFLDAQDLVLFEGVKPGGMGDTDSADSADDAAKAKLTKARVRMLAVFLERYHAEHSEYPETLDALIASLQGTPARVLGGARTDAWGREILFQRSATRILEGAKELWSGDEFDLISRGSDGHEGGEGGAADLRFSQQDPLTKRERSGKGEGVQVKLAQALGLEFQLAAMNYTRAGWRNSDMSIDQVQDRMKESGVDADALFSMLDGNSMGSKVMGMILGFIQRDPAMSMMAKIMMVETVAHADELMDSQPAAMGKMMKVIVVDRNEVVLADLRKVLDTEPNIKSVALFYGAGHLPHMEKRLTEDFGYTQESSRWFTAMDIDLTSVKGAKAQSKQMRDMIRGMAKKKNAGE